MPFFLKKPRSRPTHTGVGASVEPAQAIRARSWARAGGADRKRTAAAAAAVSVTNFADRFASRMTVFSPELFLVELLDEAGRLDVANETLIDERLRVRRGGFGIGMYEVVEHRLHAVRGGHQVFGEDDVVGAIGALEALGIGDAKIFAEDHFRP